MVSLGAAEDLRSCAGDQAACEAAALDRELGGQRLRALARQARIRYAPEVLDLFVLQQRSAAEAASRIGCVGR